MEDEKELQFGANGHRNHTEAGLLEFQQVWLSDNRLDINEFCERHPDCGPELRRMIRDFLFVTEASTTFHGGKSKNSFDTMKATESTRKILGDF